MSLVHIFRSRADLQSHASQVQANECRECHSRRPRLMRKIKPHCTPDSLPRLSTICGWASLVLINAFISSVSAALDAALHCGLTSLSSTPVVQSRLHGSSFCTSISDHARQSSCPICLIRLILLGCYYLVCSGNLFLELCSLQNFMQADYAILAAGLVSS